MGGALRGSSFLFFFCFVFKYCQKTLGSMESAEILPFKKKSLSFYIWGAGGPDANGIQNLRWQGDIYNNLGLTRTA